MLQWPVFKYIAELGEGCAFGTVLRRGPSSLFTAVGRLAQTIAETTGEGMKVRFLLSFETQEEGGKTAFSGE